ncbi:MAG: hypothetical protein L3J78_00915 [Thermoplasmata archaeon]|nr:hypothetical protein [Thermoplasmata archaeon]
MVSWLPWASLASAAVWLAVVGFQVSRYRYRTWTEAFLLGTCACFVLYAAGDVVVFWASSPADAWLAEVLGTGALTMSAAFFVLFAAALHGRPLRDLTLVCVPCGVMIVLGPLLLVAPPIATGGGIPTFLPRYTPLGLALWAAYIDAYGLTGIVPLYRSYREIRAQVQVSAGRAFAFLMAAICVMGLWTSWNVAVLVLRDATPPFFSAALVVPGIIALVGSLPPTRTGFMGSLHQAKRGKYGVQAAFLLHKGGLLIHSSDVWREVGVDADLFGATLDVIQNFMRTSFPTLGSPGLRSVAFGNRTLVIERGRYTYLVLVLAGQDDEILRWTMRDLLRGFEGRNAEVLRNWSGVPSETRGTGEMLTALVRMQ